MIATISTTLHAPADRVARLVQRSDTLLYISGPLLRFVPIRPAELPDIWSPESSLPSSGCSRKGSTDGGSIDGGGCW
jgi:hypothetical protein